MAKFKIPFFTKKSVTPTTVNNSGWMPGFVPLNYFANVSKTNLDTRTVEGQRDAYLYCPVVSMVINTKVAMSCNAEFYFENEKTEKKTIPAIQSLIDRPNEKQDWLQFWQFAKTLQQIHGRAYIYVRNLPGIKYPKEMYVIPNWELKIEKNQNSDFWSDNVSYYTWVHNQKTIRIECEDMLIMNDTGMDLSSSIGEYQQGGSRLITLGDAVQNIVSAYEARGRILKNGGPAYILSPAKDGTGASLMTPDEKASIEQKMMNNYGLQRGKNTLLMASMTMNATKLGLSPTDMAAFEEVTEDCKEVCRGYGLSPYLFGFSDTTFNNFSEAQKTAYVNTIIPEVRTDLKQIQSYFKVPESFEADFSDVEVVQENDKDKADLLASLTNSLTSLVNAQILTADEARTILQSQSEIVSDGKE